MSLHSDCSRHPLVQGARLVRSHGCVHLVLLPSAGLIVSRFVGATLSRLEPLARRLLCCTAVPHLVQPPGTDSRCRSLSSACCWLWPVSTFHCVLGVLLMPHRCGSPATFRHSGLVSGHWRVHSLQSDRAWDRIFYLCKAVLVSSRTNSTTAKMCEVN